MDRFVAMIWDPDDLGRQGQVFAWSKTLQRQSLKWICALDRPGLRVFSYQHRGDSPVVTRWKGDDGIVIGVLFERGQEKKGRVQNLDQRVAERVITSRGDELIQDFWGNYIAIWRDLETRKTTVLRDPCAAVPCFMTRQCGVELLFAHANDVADFPGLGFTIDWTFLQAFILHDFFITKHTGLKEVVELLGGERIELKPNGERILSWAWNGAEIAAQPDFQSFDDAKRELSKTMEACFTAWGKEYRKVLVMLSGGLDSSIVVNLLRSVSDAEIKALHYVGVSYEEYEVKLARLAAERADVEMIEVRADLGKEDVSGMLNVPRLARPSKETAAVLADEIATNVANSTGADCFINGQAGDTLFLQRGIAKHTLSDYVRLRGFGGGFSRVAYDAAMLRKESIWAVMGDGLANRRWQPYAFLNDTKVKKQQALVETVARTIPETYRRHSWLANAERLPSGKGRHLNGVIALSRFHPVRGHGIAFDVISSFFCQPVVEFVLRTPTYIFCDGGLDRALERCAFGDLIPEDIARRTDKGGISVAVWQGLRANLDFFRGLILEGALAGQGWIDRPMIDRMLSAEGVTRGVAPLLIYKLAAAEAWLKSWRATSACAAA